MPIKMEITFSNGNETKTTMFSRYTESWESIETYAEAGTEYDDVCISDIEVYSAKLWTD